MSFSVNTGQGWWSREVAKDRGWRTRDAVKADREPYGKDKRRYVVELKNGDRVWMASVTTLLGYLAKPGLDNWMIDQTLAAISEQWQPKTSYLPQQIDAALAYAKEARWRKLTEAAGYGTRVHGIVEGFLRGLEWPTFYSCDNKTGVVTTEPVNLEAEPIQVQNSVQLWLEWWNQQNLSIEIVEGYVYNLEQGYAGAFDYLAEDQEGNTVLIDWKTSKGIYDTHALQLVAYGGALAAMGKGLPDKGLVLCVSKEGEAFEELWVWQSPEEFRQIWTRWCGLIGIKDLKDLVDSRKRQHRLSKQAQPQAKKGAA